MLRINDLTQLYLGIQGENKSRTIVIDVADWLVSYPNGSLSIWIKRPGDATATATGAVFDAEEKTVTWQPDSVDTYVAGEGTAEIRLTEGTVIKKTREIRIAVSPAVTGGGTVLGSDWQSYINEVDRQKSLATAAATAAEASALDAEEAKDEAVTAAEEAEQDAQAAEEAKAEAVAAKDGIEEARDAAIAAKNAAEGSATAAAGSATAAEGSATAAAGSATAAERAKDEAVAAKTAAEAAQEAAEEAAEEAGEAALALIDDTAGAGDTDKVWSADKTLKEVNTKADVIISSASGSIASFSDGADELPIKELKVAIEPVQDLHGYDFPWPAGGGKNLLNANESYTFNSQTNLVTCSIPAGTYKFSADVINNNTSIVGYVRVINGSTVLSSIVITSGTKTRLSSESFTLSEAAELTIRGAGASSGYNCTVSNLQICLASATNPDVFAPYSNICPITGWTGAKVTRTGKNLYSRKNGEYNVPVYGVDGSATSYADVLVVWLKVKPNTTYHVSFVEPTQEFYFRWINCDKNKGFISRPGNVYPSRSIIPDFTTTAETEWIEIAVNQYDIGNLSKNDWLICISETATAYEPYQGETYDITFPSEAGTVYGGTLDVTSGMLTVDRVTVDLGTLNYGYNATYKLFSAYKGDMKAHGMCISSQYKYSDGAGAPDMTCCLGYTGWFVNNIVIKDSRYTDVATFKSAMSGVQLVYELTTPVSYQLTPQEIRTLLGVNNIWADTGDINLLTYPVDTSIRVDNVDKRITTVLSAMVAPVLTDMIADTALAVNQFRIVNDTLYKVTAPIASGGTLTPGTNVIATSIGEQITALLNA